VKIGIVKPIDGGILTSVASLAIVNRALICASLSDTETFIECNERPDDIYTTIKSLNARGAKIRYNGNGYEVIPIGIPETDRGFSAAAAAHGYAGQNNKGVYRLPGETAYRDINGLFFTLPIQNNDNKIITDGREEYSSSIQMTVDMLGTFGVKVERITRNDGGAEYIIAGNQKFRSPGTIKEEGDWTNSAFWLSAAAICGSGVICENLIRSSRQADKEIVSILERFGAITAYKGDSVAVRQSRLRSIRIDAAISPNIIPAVAVVASVSDGQSVIYNAERVGLGRSGMLNKINTTLSALGADIIENSDGLIIQGKPQLKGGTVSSQNDSRITMMAAIAACACEDPVAITTAESLSQTYPDFLTHFETLGGTISKK